MISRGSRLVRDAQLGATASGNASLQKVACPRETYHDAPLRGASTPLDVRSSRGDACAGEAADELGNRGGPADRGFA
jgi:hypothetical protein